MISYEFEQKSFNLQKENPVEVLNVHCTVQDQAGNEKKADYEVTVTYTGLDAAALIEKTGLILQTSDDTANEKKPEVVIINLEQQILKKFQRLVKIRM